MNATKHAKHRKYYNKGITTAALHLGPTFFLGCHYIKSHCVHSDMYKVPNSILTAPTVGYIMTNHIDKYNGKNEYQNVLLLHRIYY